MTHEETEAKIAYLQKQASRHKRRAELYREIAERYRTSMHGVQNLYIWTQRKYDKELRRAGWYRKIAKRFRNTILRRCDGCKWSETMSIRCDSCSMAYLSQWEAK